jgi:hypothetical protein
LGVELGEAVATGEGDIEGVWVAEGVKFGTEGLGIELCACTFRTAKDEETNIAAKKNAAKNKIPLFTLCKPIISLTRHH